MLETMTAEEFNRRYPVGTPVAAYPLTLDDEPLITCTRTPAWSLGHGAVVVSVQGEAGEIVLTHIRLRPGGDTPRPLACGMCFEENGEEIHPHPECMWKTPPKPCRWPACLSEDEQQQLADDVRTEMLGQQAPPGDLPACDCDEVMALRRARPAPGFDPARHRPLPPGCNPADCCGDPSAHGSAPSTEQSEGPGSEPARRGEPPCARA